jgi:sulfoacetaldehyde acetyltransferase
MATMTASEGMVETLRRFDVDRVFGIVGSAFIDPLDLFPRAGIRFVDVQHEQNAVHMADGFARVSGRHGVAIGQNGPGITNMLTGVATAFMTHAPVTVISPQCGSDSVGKLGFQEMDQMPPFSSVTHFQAHVPHSARLPELLGLALNRAQHRLGPTQLNVPRDLFHAAHDYGELPAPIPAAAAVPAEADVDRICELVAAAQRPVVVAGYGCRDPAPLRRLAAALRCPVATTYLHNDVFPAGDPHAVGSLGYMGSRAAMRSVADADLVVALGTRLNPFGTTPQYGLAYWDPQKPLIQVDHSPAALGRSCAPTLAACADASATAAVLAARLPGRPEPSIDFGRYRREWEAELAADSAQPEQQAALRPKAALWALRSFFKRLDAPVVTTDIGHCCSQALAYLEFERPRSLLTAGTFGSCGTAIPFALGARFADPHRPVFALVGDGAAGMQGTLELLTARRCGLGVTVVVFRNNVWGAELLNQLIWTDARAVGTVIPPGAPSIAKLAEACGCAGREVRTVGELEGELAASVAEQARGVTTLIEVHCSPEMGAPFRVDAMRCPQRLLPKYADLSVDVPRFDRQHR